MRIFKLLLICVWLATCECSEGADQKDVQPVDPEQTVYYFDSRRGDDRNEGSRPDAPYRSLHVLTYARIKPGDVIYLAAGSQFRGNIDWTNVSGTAENPVTITSYGDSDELPCIDARGLAAGICLQNCSHLRISNLRIMADGSGGVSHDTARDLGQRCGLIYRVTAAGSYTDIQVENLQVEKIFIEEPGYERDPDDVNSANGTEQYGYGIRFVNNTVEGAQLSGIVVRNCQVRDVSHTGIQFSGRKYSITDSEVSGCTIERSGGPGMQMSGVRDIHIHHNRIDYSGYPEDSRNWKRGSGYWCWGSDRILFEYNRMTNANGPHDSAGAHIDYNCSNIVYQYNFSANNAGGFCEILGNNYNCCYRYNVSVNDGQRVKQPKGQWGFTVMISGYTGSKSVGPFNSYVYNNTIYTDTDKQSVITLTKTAEGLCLVNNIFCIKGSSQLFQNNDTGPITRALMKNNLFYATTSWPADSFLNDTSPIYGDPDFANPGGWEIADYLPGNESLIKDRGIVLEPLPEDAVGLEIGLKVGTDILGNPVDDRPDIGAIELRN